MPTTLHFVIVPICDDGHDVDRVRHELAVDLDDGQQPARRALEPRGLVAVAAHVDPLDAEGDPLLFELHPYLCDGSVEGKEEGRKEGNRGMKGRKLRQRKERRRE